MNDLTTGLLSYRRAAVARSAPVPLPAHEPTRRDAARTDDAATFTAALGLYGLLWLALSLVDYAYIDDRGRALWGSFGWEDNGRPLTSLVMRVFASGGQLFDAAPLPQLLAIALMALGLVVLRRQLRARFSWGLVACAAPLFATPLYAENMAYSFDSLTMTLGGLAAVAAVGGVWPVRRSLAPRLAAATALLVGALCLYQPTINLFLALCCLQAALAGGAARWRQLGRGSLATLVALGAAFALYSLIAGAFMPDSGYSADHARTWPLASLAPGVLHNFGAVFDHLRNWLPRPVKGLLLLLPLLVALALGLRLWAVRREGALLRRVLAVAGFTALLALALYGPMLALAEPIWKPRTFVGLGGVVCALLLLAWRLAPAVWLRRLVALVAGAFLLFTLAGNAVFANLLARHAADETRLLTPLAQEINRQAREHQRDKLAILGTWRFAPVVARGRGASRLYRELLPPSLHEGSYWNEPGLDLYGMAPRIDPVSREALPANAAWALVQETAAYRLEASGDYLRLSLKGGG